MANLSFFSATFSYFPVLAAVGCDQIETNAICDFTGSGSGMYNNLKESLKHIYVKFINLGLISGSVTLKEAQGTLAITGDLSGFPGSGSAKHGFHIHTEGELGNSCVDAGGHYNPEGVAHGAPNATVRTHLYM